MFSCSRTDGSFAVNDVPSGSYVVEVVSPNYKFEPVRVDITTKGKMRWDPSIRGKANKRNVHSCFMFLEPEMCIVTYWSNLVSFHRARLVNYIKTTEVNRQPYPLQVRANGPHSYFMKRETWGWTDFLMNPMVKKQWTVNNSVCLIWGDLGQEICITGHLL